MGPHPIKGAKGMWSMPSMYMRKAKATRAMGHMNRGLGQPLPQKQSQQGPLPLQESKMRQPSLSLSFSMWSSSLSTDVAQKGAKARLSGLGHLLTTLKALGPLPCSFFSLQVNNGMIKYLSKILLAKV